ncbi:SAM-dependent methyltransferase, partial [Streptomyces sp. SID14478]|nr:SAM-dependent methyltransferase [Streptomyces sp. SID14478]
MTTTTPLPGGLRGFYENPTVPVASGTPRTLR